MGYPPSACGAPPWKGGATSGPAKPDPRCPPGWIVCVPGEWCFGTPACVQEIAAT
jgi:hypothetical protein